MIKPITAKRQNSNTPELAMHRIEQNVSIGLAMDGGSPQCGAACRFEPLVFRLMSQFELSYARGPATRQNDATFKNVYAVITDARPRMLYLIRHGETEWNLVGRYQGAKDSPLTVKGRSQARAVGRLLKSQVGDGVPLSTAVSPLGRAQETARLISWELPLLSVLEPRIAEVSIGAWDGLTDFEIDAEYPDALAGATAFDWFFRSPDGETLDCVIDRVSKWLSDNTTRPLLAVSHGLTGRIIRGVYLGLCRDEMLSLPVPQDGIFLLDCGKAEFLSALP